MANNSMTISFSENSLSSDSDSATSNLRRNPLPPPPPAATTAAGNQHLPNVGPLAKRSLGRSTGSAAVAKKPRGRPTGSKNKPKLGPSTLPVEPQCPGPSHVMVSVAPGRDVMASILDVAHGRHLNLTVLNASGTIASVTLSNSHHGANPITLNGPFTLLSMNGTYSFNHQYPLLSFSIELSTSQGQLFGGPIGGRVIASDNVRIFLYTYTNLEFYNDTPQVRDHDNNNNNNYNDHSSSFNGGGNLSGFNMVSVGNSGR